MTTDLLVQVETENGLVTIDIKFYASDDYQRVYTPNPLASITDSAHYGSFNIQILIEDPFAFVGVPHKSR